MNKKIFVSGCFDLFHSGHVAFIEEAASYGDLYVGLGSDETVFKLKGRSPVNTENERLYMIKALKYVKDVWINSGSGLMDFIGEIKDLKPDIFFVNEDGYTPDKLRLCHELGIELIVSKRIPHKGLLSRSTTALRRVCNIPFRLDLAGGWLDQPYVSKYYPGPVITISIHPDYQFHDRSGMASSTRKKAVQLWQTDIPEGNKEILAKTLFSFENPPGTKIISGSQDSIGIVFPGVNKLYYHKEEYWPKTIMSITDPKILTFIEKHLYFITLSPRTGDFDVLSEIQVNQTKAKSLADAANRCWEAVQKSDLNGLGKSMRDSFEAQISMFPKMVNPEIMEFIESFKNIATGWKLSGAGGGGYLILVSEKPIQNAIQIQIVR